MQASSKSNAFQTMRRQFAKSCPEHRYQTYIFSTDLLVIYLEKFMTEEEARCILNLA